MNNKIKNNPERIKNKSGHDMMRSQKSQIGIVRVHHCRHHWQQRYDFPSY
jgi:hypothetical protein